MEALKAFFTWDNLAKIGIRLAIAVIIFVAGLFLIKGIIALMKKIFRKTGYDKAAGNLVTQIVKAILWICLLLGVLSVLGVAITGFVAVISAATVAIGIALQGSLSNLASGIIIASTKPFHEGDFVEIEGISGTIKNINFFTTEMLTVDNKKVIIPNSQITSSCVTNFNEQALRMINMNIPVSYDSDVEQAQKILLEIMDGHSLVEKDPLPSARLENFGASSIDINIRAWVKSSEYRSVFWDLNEAIYKQFKESGITIPYQQIDVSIKEFAGIDKEKLLKIKDIKEKENDK